MWKGRKSAFAAMGRISPNYYVQDGVIPRKDIAAGPARDRAARPRGRSCASPTSFTPATATCIRSCSTMRASPAKKRRAERVGGEILRVCLRYGGSVTGEHGVGRDKACYLGEQFFARRSGDDEARALRRSIPDGCSIPDKVFPTPRLCGDRPGRLRAASRSNAAAKRVADDARLEHRRRRRRARIGARRSRRTRVDRRAISTRRQRRLRSSAAAPNSISATPPRALDAVVRTTALDRVVDYAPEDQTITVEAGMRSPRSTRCSPNTTRCCRSTSPTGANATVGGAIATNAFGARRHRYGSIKDLIVGIEIVRPDGVDRARRRQGREERRRLRSPQADGRFARHAGRDRERDVSRLPRNRARRRRVRRAAPRRRRVLFAALLDDARSSPSRSCTTRRTDGVRADVRRIRRRRRRRRSRTAASAVAGAHGVAAPRCDVARRRVRARARRPSRGRVRAASRSDRRVPRAATAPLAGVRPRRAVGYPTLGVTLARASDAAKHARRRRRAERARAARRSSFARCRSARAARRCVGRTAAVVRADARAQGATSIRKGLCNPGRFVGGL